MSYNDRAVAEYKGMHGGRMITFHLLGLFILLAAGKSYAKTGYFWHITDIHYDSMFSVTGDIKRGCWRPDVSRNARRPAGRFGDYACDTPWDLIESAAQAMKTKQGDNIEFVLWTGDALSHTAKRLPEARQLELLQNVTDLLKRTFSSQFVFPALGHDDPAVLKKHIGELWRRWLPPDSMHTFEKGGYYLIEQKMKRLQIVVLNTNLLIGREGRDGRQDPIDEEAKRMWDWLDVILAKCLVNRETVYIVGHIPPGSDERQRGAMPLPQTSYSDHNNRRYFRIVRKYADIIQGQFFGHHHSDSFRIIYSEKGRPVSWAMLAPSVTPRRTSDGPNNPGLRLYKFDSDTGQIHDYTQFYLDLSKANALLEAEWMPAYNLTSYYGLTNVTALSLHNLAEKFTQPTAGENTLFVRYFVANSVRMFNSPALGGCDLSCAHTHYCAITRIDYREYRHCLETAASALASTSVTNTLNSQLHFILLIIALVFLLR